MAVNPVHFVFPAGFFWPMGLNGDAEWLEKHYSIGRRGKWGFTLGLVLPTHGYDVFTSGVANRFGQKENTAHA